MNEQSPHTDIVNDWIIGYLTNSLTPEEMQSLQNWLNVSEENRKHFSDMQEVWIAASDEADEQYFDKEQAYQLFLEHTENPCATIGKTKNTHYQSVDVCRCNGCNCFFLWNDCLSEWKESTPESIDTDYGGSSIRFKNQIVSS